LTKINFIVASVDCEEASLLEMLGDDIEDFFFGVPITVETKEVNEKSKRAPLKSIKYVVE
jgi:hypothetical protein